jgi:ATP-dependent helicase YprA (DUF1998 family)
MKLDMCLKRLCRLQSSYQRLSQRRLLATSQSPTTGVQTGKSTIDREAFIFGDKSSFVSCGLSPELLSALSSAGKSTPTVIQAKSFPAIESGKNVVVGAETGSGKTLAYLLPILPFGYYHGSEQRAVQSSLSNGKRNTVPSIEPT